MIFKIPKAGIVMRDKKILELCKGKRVLHLGFCDWPFTKERLENKELLHQKLDEVCTDLIGVDIDEASINLLKKKGVKNLFCQDIYTLFKIKKAILQKKFEIILVADILEHLENPVAALKEIRKISSKETKIIVSVPNFRNYFNIFYGLFNKELNHPEDHLFWPSFVTMNNIFKKAGFRVKGFYYSLYGEEPPKKMMGKLFYKFFLNNFSAFSHGMIFVLEKDRE